MLVVMMLVVVVVVVVVVGEGRVRESASGGGGLWGRLEKKRKVNNQKNVVHNYANEKFTQINKRYTDTLK